MPKSSLTRDSYGNVRKHPRQPPVQLAATTPQVTLHVDMDPTHYAQALALKIKGGPLKVMASFEELILVPDDQTVPDAKQGAVMTPHFSRNAGLPQMSQRCSITPGDDAIECVIQLASLFNARFDHSTALNVEGIWSRSMAASRRSAF